MYLRIRTWAFTSGGFPHSDICGSMAVCALPQLFAACHVLRRLLVPRHSPCALYSLTYELLFGNYRRTSWAMRLVSIVWTKDWFAFCQINSSVALLISQQNTRNIKRWFNTPKWVGLCGLTSAFTLLFKHTPSNCYLAIIEEPLEPCDWYQSYGRKTGSPFAKSIHVWLWWI